MKKEEKKLFTFSLTCGQAISLHTCIKRSIEEDMLPKDDIAMLEDIMKQIDDKITDIYTVDDFLKATWNCFDQLVDGGDEDDAPEWTTRKDCGIN